MKTYYLLKLASWLSRFMPTRVGYWLASLAGSIIFLLVPSQRTAIEDNMRHVLPNSTTWQRRRIARRVVCNQIKNYYDLVRLPHLKPEDVRRMIPDIEGLEHLDAVMAQGRGAVIFGGHIGNFTIVAQLGAILGYRMAIVAEDIQPEKLYHYVNHMRESLGLEMIRMGSAEVRTIFKYMREGGALMLAGDRDVTDAGVPVPFFGLPADMPAGPVVLAQRLKVPFLPCHTMRRRDNTSVLKIYPPLELQRTGDHEADERANLLKAAHLLEEMIKQAPDQWVVLQRVWDKDYTALTEVGMEGSRNNHSQQEAPSPQAAPALAEK